MDKTRVTMEPKKSGGGGAFYVPGNDRVFYKPPEKKSPFGLHVFANANAKREGHISERIDNQHDSSDYGKDYNHQRESGGRYEQDQCGGGMEESGVDMKVQ
ncbi:hypothetical protein Pyn_01892 [Prunus yedoensis var. nudiflora]|uniref:Uncharacterized protein n=1 Tax=Prunus yedoensis var. nudiflora TaxID=2094558 RepID=A0A314XXK4_PRUYE|nr:hypothetical protein Pyn_01892 [Prunus yedoensis var. nudiflora]